MVKLPSGVSIKERAAKGTDEEYEQLLGVVLTDTGYTAGVIAAAISMMHKLSPSQERELMKMANGILEKFLVDRIKESGGMLDYRDAYGLRASLANRLFRELAEQADKMPEKTEMEILEEVAFAVTPAAGAVQ